MLDIPKMAKDFMENKSRDMDVQNRLSGKVW